MFAQSPEYANSSPRPILSKRQERARRARDTKNRVIPELLRDCPRAKHGIAKAEIIVDPPPVHETPRTSSDPVTRPDLKIRIRQQDSICVAAGLSDYPFATRRSAPSRSRPTRPNIAVLNMCSATSPGGGFLDGANGQEEYLCHRTTLYPSLWNSFYRLPEVSGIYTPDVLVFRTNDVEDNDLPKRERYFVDVISSSIFRYSEARAEGCSCSDFSFCDVHRDLVFRKMKAVLRIAQAKGVQRLILGAWGCGTNYGAPMKEIAKAWRKVIAGAPRQRRPNSEQWDGIQEIIFAIPDQKIVGEFRSAFGDVISEDIPTPMSEVPPQLGAERELEMERTSELMTRVAEVEMELEQTNSRSLRQRLRAVHEDLMREINRGMRREPDSDSEPQEEEEGIDAEAEDYVMSGFLNSDDEHNPFFAGFDARSDGSVSPAASENFEFRPPPPGLASNEESASLDEHSEDGLDRQYSNSSQNFDEGGWFHGSLDGLSAQLNIGGRVMRSCSRNSPGSPDVMRPSSSSQLPIDAHAVAEYLSRYQGTDELDC